MLGSFRVKRIHNYMYELHKLYVCMYVCCVCIENLYEMWENDLKEEQKLIATDCVLRLFNLLTIT